MTTQQNCVQILQDMLYLSIKPVTAYLWAVSIPGYWPHRIPRERCKETWHGSRTNPGHSRLRTHQCRSSNSCYVTPEQGKGCQYIDGLVQDCSISSALAMEILQSCSKPSTCSGNWQNLLHLHMNLDNTGSSDSLVPPDNMPLPEQMLILVNIQLKAISQECSTYQSLKSVG